MKYVLSLLFFFISFFTISQAQQAQPWHVVTDQETPQWFHLLNDPQVNVLALDHTVEKWLKLNPNPNQTYLRYYKKWRRSVNDYITPEGKLVFPDSKTLIAANQANLFKKESKYARSASTWQSLGPFETVNDAINGTQVPVSWQANIYALDQSTSNPNVLYCGTEGGEVYKTNDKGLTWFPASRSLNIGAVTAVSIHPTNTQTVYVGSRDGVYKTEDGGETWDHILVVANFNVHKISIHPTLTDNVHAAGNSGLWVSTNNGTLWNQLFPEKCYDLARKPGAPEVMYLLKNDPNDQRCTFWKSNNSGLSFIPKQDGWFDGVDAARQDGGGRLSVTPSNPERIYAVLIGQAKEGDNGFIGVYRSDNSGETWLLPNPPAGGPYSNAHPNLAVINPYSGTGFHQGFYNLGIGADHLDADQLLVGHLNLWRSTDGAQSFELIGGYGGSLPWIHPDVQDIQVLNGDTWVCTDGGINYSTNFFLDHESRKQGIVGSDYWGFSQGWNDDIMVGGRYHNGNSGWLETYPEGIHLRLGGGEAPTGYLSPGPERKAYFSDIGGKIIPSHIEIPSSSFPVSKWPNELYFAAESSDQVWLPDCYNHYYTGTENGLWLTEDGGSAFKLIKEFDQPNAGRITQIALCRDQPEHIIVAQRNEATWSEGWIWKTNDRGVTWNAVSLPEGYKRRFVLAMDASDPQRFYIGYTDANNGQKLYRTADGGATWINISSPLFDNEQVQAILAPGGTDGDLILGTSHSAYHFNGQSNTWSFFGDGLPERISCNILRPFYRDSKVRLGAYGKGLWEADLPNSFTPIIQPMVDKKIAYCIRDSFWFDDHSILDHSGVSWKWSFPGGEPNSSLIRNPKVSYPNSGTFTATLEVSGPFGTLSKDIIIEVRDECSPDTIPGLALRTIENGDAAVLKNDGEELYEALTFAAWVKPEGEQSSYAGIIIGSHQDNAFGINVRDNNRLGYHWPGGAWWWDSGFDLIPGEWQHVAIVVQPGSITLYHNGIGTTHVTNPQPVSLNGISIGRYRDWSGRTFKGWIDEVAIWGQALNQDEIRKTMHLTKKIADHPSLIAYYQFNRVSGEETDRVGIKHLSFAGGAHRVPSTVPAGGGTSTMLTIPLEGTYPDLPTGTKLIFNEFASLPDGEIVLNKLNVSPDQHPAPNFGSNAGYWITNYYGNDNFTQPILGLKNAGPIYSSNLNNPKTLELWERVWNGEGDNWSLAGQALELNIDGADTFMVFDSGKLPNQWIVVNTGDTTTTSVNYGNPNRLAENSGLLYPNPCSAGQPIKLLTSLSGPLSMRILDVKGRIIVQQPIQNHGLLETTHFSKGLYFYEIKNKTQMIRGQIVVE